ncbi:FAD-dependent oxidoreductase [Nocardioides sp.]|uniref:FAD-dependent oxidoreductase n=1 Tax=Nocardioides sp. TaxID=35761 RepID=UPI002D7E789A|nr:FAD-dependent oxidoreductase [Nocardioides sp.]HET8960117.1 FAD-dependent oxidoreductase [Nocardioides sp.]
MELDCDVLVVGAGCGGVAAALAATRSGRRVVLTEPTAWVGGQLTSQAVPPDEHPWVESTGTTASYRRMRQAVRDHYRASRDLTDAARRDEQLNPGSAWVSNLAAEPRVFQEVLLAMLRPAREQGLLRLLTHHAPTGASVDGDRVRAVELVDTERAETVTISAEYVLDATEEGELLPMVGCEHVIGAESSNDTGEPHALEGPANPHDQQAITWCAALEHRPGSTEILAAPAGYEFWRAYRAEHWPGPQLGWATTEPETGNPLRRPLHDDAGQDLWSFRRIRDGKHYRDARTDVTLVNWPQVDYWLAPLVGVGEEERRAALTGARELTCAFIHWLQADAPRPDGGTGYPELQPCGSVVGTADGLALRPYVREARRIEAELTVLEQHVGVEARPGATGAEPFEDTVGVGSYRIDLHPSTSGRGYLDIATYPFQVPLGALLPRRIENLVAAGKSLGVTHITNGCYRLHPVEWNVGEAAGALAAFCLERRTRPAAVRAVPELLAGFQQRLREHGVQLEWPDRIRRTRR